MALVVRGVAASRPPRPPSEPNRPPLAGRFGPKRPPTESRRKLRAARPASARQATRFRPATDLPTRPQSANPLGAQLPHRSRTPRATSLTTQRKGKLVNSLRRDEVVNAIFLRLQCGGPTADLKQLARLAQGGARRAPPSLVEIVQAEAATILGELDKNSPAQSARSSSTPGRFSRSLSPRGTPRARKNPLATGVAAAQLRIVAAVKTAEAQAKEEAEAARPAKVTMSEEAPTTVTKPRFVRPQPVVVNVCGRNMDLQDFLREKLMARGRSDCANIRHLLMKHDLDKCGRITRAQFEEFLHSVQIFLSPAELEKVFEGYGIDEEGMVDYTKLAASLIPNNYPVSKGWIRSLPEQVMRKDATVAKVSHLVGCSQQEYDALVSPRRRVSSKPPVPRQRATSAVPSSRSTSRMGSATPAPEEEPGTTQTLAAWGPTEDSTNPKDVTGKVRQALLQKRGGPDQLKRVFMFLDKHGGGTIAISELAEVLFSMGMSKRELDVMRKALDTVDSTGVTFTQFCEWVDAGPDDFVDRFDPAVYAHHDYTKLQEKMRKQAAAPVYSHDAAQVAPRSEPVENGAPALRSLQALERVLRDKAAARSRYISTEMRAALQDIPCASGGGASAADVQAVLVSYGLEVEAGDMGVLVENFQTDGDGAINLRAFIDWILPDDDHDYSQAQALGPQARQDNMRRSTPVAHDLPPSRQLEPGVPKPPWAQGRTNPRFAPSKEAATRHLLPLPAFERVLGDKLAQRHASTPRWTLRSCFRRYGGRADAIAYPAFQVCPKQYALWKLVCSFARLLTVWSLGTAVARVARRVCLLRGLRGSGVTLRRCQ